MASIYREILTSMTDTYATIISNNLNDVMKFLAGITIVFSIPTMVSSFIGMNVPLGDMGKSNISFILIIAFFICFINYNCNYTKKEKHVIIIKKVERRKRMTKKLKKQLTELIIFCRYSFMVCV